MKTIILLLLVPVMACTSYSPIPQECAFSAKSVALDDATLGFSGDDVRTWVGESPRYTVAWEPTEGLTALSDTLEIQLGAPTMAFIVTPVELVDGGCLLPSWQEHLSVVRPYSLRLGESAAGAGESESVAFGPDRVELRLEADSISLSEAYQSAALAWLQAQHPTIESISEYTAVGIFDLSAPTLAFDGRWEGSEPTTSGVTTLWRSAALSPAP